MLLWIAAGAMPPQSGGFPPLAKATQRRRGRPIAVDRPQSVLRGGILQSRRRYFGSDVAGYGRLGLPADWYSVALAPFPWDVTPKGCLFRGAESTSRVETYYVGEPPAGSGVL